MQKTQEEEEGKEKHYIHAETKQLVKAMSGSKSSLRSTPCAHRQSFCRVREQSAPGYAGS